MIKLTLAGLLSFFASQCFAFEAFNLANAILARDPEIAKIQPMPLKRAPVFHRTNFGDDEAYQLAVSRMWNNWNHSMTSSPEDVFPKAREATKIVLKKLDPEFLREIRKVARLYRIPATHILAPIVTEMVFNDASVGKLQDLAGKIIGATDLDSSATEMINHREAQACQRLASSYLRWDCRVRAINDSHYLFLNIKDPIFMTYGLGQFSPLKVLMLRDFLIRISGLSIASEADVKSAFAITLDPKKVIHAIAANAVMTIAVYRKITSFDLFLRPDLTSTIYNLGGERTRAFSLLKRQESNKLLFPRNNYFGEYVSRNVDLLQAALGSP